MAMLTSERHAFSRDIGALFEATCVSATLSAMAGERDVSAHFSSAIEPPTRAHRALQLYVEGTALLNLPGVANDSALHNFEAALEVDPHWVLAHAGIGVVYYRRGEYCKSFRAFATVLQELGTDCPN